MLELRFFAEKVTSRNPPPEFPWELPYFFLLPCRPSRSAFPPARVARFTCSRVLGTAARTVPGIEDLPPGLPLSPLFAALWTVTHEHPLERATRTSPADHPFLLPLCFFIEYPVSDSPFIFPSRRRLRGTHAGMERCGTFPRCSSPPLRTFFE